jgi:hypothetical protein
MIRFRGVPPKGAHGGAENELPDLSLAMAMGLR